MGLEIGISSLAIADRIEFFRTFSSWLTAGGGSLPVHEAIRNTCSVFSTDDFKTLRRQMDRIVNDYMSGEVTFAQGLRRAVIGFTHQELAIIEAAEKSNQLRVAVPALVEAMVLKFESSKSLKKQMMMPIVGGFMLILMTVGVLIFMMPVVMEPTLQRDPAVLAKFPAIIAGMWHLSVWFREYYTLTVAVVVCPVILLLIRNTPWVKPHFEKVLMRIGVARKIMLSFNAVLVVYFMPALVRANIPLPQVLGSLAGSLDNDTIAATLRKAAYEHEQGYRLGEVLKQVPFKSSFRNAVDAGEKTGKIAERVEDLKGPYKSEFERVSQRAVASLKMIVMIVLMPMFIVVMYSTLVTPMIALMEYV